MFNAYQKTNKRVSYQYAIHDTAVAHPHRIEVCDGEGGGAGLEVFWNGDGVVLTTRRGPLALGEHSGVVWSSE